MIKHILTLVWNKKRNNFLLFLEVFLAFLILFGVITLTSQYLNSYREPLGFDDKNVWVAHLELEDGIDSLGQVLVKEQLVQEFENFKEIETYSFSDQIVPYVRSMNAFGHDRNGFRLLSFMLRVDEHYKDAFDVKMLKGRWFNESDKNAKYTSVVLTQGLVEKYVGDREVLDSVLLFDENEEVKVVGICESFRYMGEFSSEKRLSFIYDDHSEANDYAVVFEIKEGVPPSFEETLNTRIASVIKRNDFIIDHLENERVKTSRDYWVPIIALYSICGFLIINIALGLFGVLWYNINKRRPEVGLRRALGASKRSISVQFMSEILLVSFFSVLLGLFFAIQLPLLKLLDVENINYYYGMIGASLIILLVVLICTLYPSRQASLIHPAIALHEE